MSDIAPGATSARETARGADGRFGAQPAPECLADAVVLEAAGPEAETFEAPVATAAGLWSVTDASTELAGAGWVAHHMRGRPHVRTRTGAAAALYADHRDPKAVAEEVEGLCRSGAKMTVLTRNSNGDIKAIEGTGSGGGSEPVVLLPRSPMRPLSLDGVGGADPVLDVAPGHDRAQDLAESWNTHGMARTPQLTKVDDFEDVPVRDPRVDQDDVAAVYFVDNPGWGNGPTSGCLFFATDRQPGDGPEGGDIVNGQFWAPKDSDLTSESSSMYSGDIKRAGGKVAGYTPGSMDFTDAWKHVPGDRAGAYDTVLGRDRDRE